MDAMGAEGNSEDARSHFARRFGTVTDRRSEARQRRAGAASDASGRPRVDRVRRAERPISLKENRAFSVVTTGAVGVEPTTARLTVECSAIELHPISGRQATTTPLSTSRHAHHNSTALLTSASTSCNPHTPSCQHAQTEGRTRIPLRVRDFESRASASSAIWAYTSQRHTSVHHWRKRRHGGRRVGGCCVTPPVVDRVAGYHDRPSARQTSHPCPYADAANPACHGVVLPEFRNSARAG